MPLDSNMIAQLTSGTGYFITLIEVISADASQVIRLAVNTRDYVFDSHTFKAFPFEMSKFQMKAGVEPDNATVQHILEGTFTRLNLVNAVWAGATITAYVVDFLHPEWGYARRHVGRIGEVTTGGYGAETEFRGLMQLLSQEIGWKTGALCRYQTGDALCGVNLANFTDSVSVLTVTNKQQFTVSPTSTRYPGLTGDYYGGIAFDVLVGQRVDSTINFDWTGIAPYSGQAIDNYSVRWQGKVKPAYTGTWTFYLDHDDGGKLWVNNTLLVDQWGTLGEHSGTISLTANTEYDIKVEYFQGPGWTGNIATCKLRWSHASQAYQIIPSDKLFSLPVTTRPDGYYAKGRAIWTSGANNGAKMEIADNTGDAIELFLPMKGTIAISDTVNLVAGDDKTLRTCWSKFANAINFGGEDSIPRREDVYHIPD